MNKYHIHVLLQMKNEKQIEIREYLNPIKTFNDNFTISKKLVTKNFFKKLILKPNIEDILDLNILS